MRFTQILLKARWEKEIGAVGEMTEKYSNLPKSYIRRAMRQIEWQTPKHNPRYMPQTIERKRFLFTANRPWTQKFWFDNRPGEQSKKVFVEPIETWSWFRGDRVQILTGRDKGKQGIINQVIEERNWVFVEGLNWKYITYGDDKDFPGVVAREERPLLVTSDIKLVDPADLQPTEFEWRYSEDGRRIRISLRTGREIPIPASNEETYDYKAKSNYLERAKDTKAKDVEMITFYPKLKTFEMDVMDEMGIEEDRVPSKTFWY